MSNDFGDIDSDMNMLIDSFMKGMRNAGTAPAKTKGNRPSIHPSTRHDSPPLSLSLCNTCSSIALHCDRSWTFTARPHALRMKGVYKSKSRSKSTSGQRRVKIAQEYKRTFTNSLAFGLDAYGLEHNFKNSWNPRE